MDELAPAPAPTLPALPNATGGSGEEAEHLLGCAGFDPVTIDELVDRSGLTADALSVILLRLELDGRLAPLPGGRYQRLA